MPPRPSQSQKKAQESQSPRRSGTKARPDRQDEEGPDDTGNRSSRDSLSQARRQSKYDDTTSETSRKPSHKGRETRTRHSDAAENNNNNNEPSEGHVASPKPSNKGKERAHKAGRRSGAVENDDDDDYEPEEPGSRRDSEDEEGDMGLEEDETLNLDIIRREVSTQLF